MSLALLWLVARRGRDRYIPRAELQRLSDEYKRVAGFAREDVA